MFGFLICYAEESPQEILQETLNVLGAAQPNIVTEIIKTVAIIAAVIAIVLLLYKGAKDSPKKAEQKELTDAEAAVLRAKLDIANRIVKARSEAVKNAHKKK